MLLEGQLQKMSSLFIASRLSCLHMSIWNTTAVVSPLICDRFLMCCEIRYNLKEMAAGQDHALFLVKTSPF